MTDFVACGDARIACDVTGAGPALLLMHGAEATRHMFADLVPHLSAHFRVITYDQRDCGDTQGPDQPATLRQLADDARLLLQGLGVERAHVFGSSFGGRIAQALAATWPLCVDRLVLGSTWPLPHSLAALDPEGMRQLTALRAGLPATAQALAAWFFPEPFLVQRPALRDVFAAVRPASDRSRRRAAAVEDTLDIDWSAIRAPTLLLSGALDRVVPSTVTQSIASRLPQAQCVLLEGVGHAAALQAPVAIAQLLTRFLCPAPSLSQHKETSS